MRFTREEIKKTIEEEWDQLVDDIYPEDRLEEMADGFVPIYYNEIISDWTEMPSEYTDYWKDQYDGTIPAEMGITALMATDLYSYYRDTTLDVYKEMKEEKDN